MLLRHAIQLIARRAGFILLRHARRAARMRKQVAAQVFRPACARRRRWVDSGHADILRERMKRLDRAILFGE